MTPKGYFELWACATRSKPRQPNVTMRKIILASLRRTPSAPRLVLSFRVNLSSTRPTTLACTILHTVTLLRASPLLFKGPRILCSVAVTASFTCRTIYGQGPNDGFSQATPWNTTLNNGLNPASTLSGNPNASCETAPGVFSPCGPAFTTERLPSGNSAGGLQDVGFGATITNHDRKTPYVEQWMAGGQYSFTPNDLLDISYVGNHGANLLATGLQWDQISPGNLAQGNALFNPVPNPFFGHITSSSCGLNNSTITEAQALNPFPEYCSVFENGPAVGTSSYDALQVTYTHRWHSGLDLNLSYTYSKFMDDVQGASGWAFPGSGTK